MYDFHKIAKKSDIVLKEFSFPKKIQDYYLLKAPKIAVVITKNALYFFAIKDRKILRTVPIKHEVHPSSLGIYTNKVSYQSKVNGKLKNIYIDNKGQEIKPFKEDDLNEIYFSFIAVNDPHEYTQRVINQAKSEIGINEEPRAFMFNPFCVLYYPKAKKLIIFDFNSGMIFKSIDTQVELSCADRVGNIIFIKENKILYFNLFSYIYSESNKLKEYFDNLLTEHGKLLKSIRELKQKFSLGKLTYQTYQKAFYVITIKG